MESLPSSSSWLPLGVSLPWFAPHGDCVAVFERNDEAALSPSSPPSVQGRGFRWQSMAWSPEVSPKSESEERSRGGEACASAESSPLQRSFSSESPAGSSPPAAHRFSWSAAPSPTRISPQKQLEEASEAILLLQAWWRAVQERRGAARRHAAAALVASRWRAWKRGSEDRGHILKLVWAVRWLQEAWRRKVRDRSPSPQRFQDRQPALPMLLPLKACSDGKTMLVDMCHERPKKGPMADAGTCAGAAPVRSALRGAARRKLLGEEEDRPRPTRAQSPWCRSPKSRRKSCGSPATSVGPTPERPERRMAQETSPPSRREAATPRAEAPHLRLETGSLILSELLGQGLLMPERPLEEAPEPLSRALRELSARLPPGARIGFTASVSGVAGAAAAAFTAVRQSLGPERFLWHGTAWECVHNIVRHGFNRAYAFNARHGSKLGRGVYFAEDPAYALRFAGRTQSSRALLLAGVLPGNFTRGKEGLLEPPRCDASGKRFDSTTDDTTRPRVFCVFKDFQALPLYLIQVIVAS